MHKTNKKKKVCFDKIIGFGRQVFSAVLRSRTGALSELATLLRFQRGTKGFEREYNKLVPPEGRAVHVMPSGEVMIPLPATTSWLPVHATEYKLFAPPVARTVHTLPSGDVRMVPLLPTATN